MKTISVLCPTRQRPQQFERMRQSALETADSPSEIEFVIYLDEDDKGYSYTPNEVIIVRGSRIVLSKMWNKCQENAKADIFMHAGDDIVFRTKGWDTMVTQAFLLYPDRIAFVNGTDGAPKGVLPYPQFGTHGFLHRNWVKAVGYFVPPYFSSDYNDTWLNEVADRINRHVFLPDLLTEHMHWTFGKSEVDQNTRDRIERHNRDNVVGLYRNYAPQRSEDVQKLTEFITNFKNV